MRRLRKLGETALEAGDHDTAEKVLKQVVSKVKYSEFKDPQDHVRLVQTLVRKGDPVQAAAVIRDLDKSMAFQKGTALCSAIASSTVSSKARTATASAVVAKSRALSMAIAAWWQKVSRRSRCLSPKRLALIRLST